MPTRNPRCPRRAIAAAAAVLALGAFALGAFAPRACADGLDDVRAAGVLVWGADAEGGAPFVYDDPREEGGRKGFEVELASLLAARLGVRAELKQHNWAELVPGLVRGDFDVALNGLEIVDYRERDIDFTRPYYACPLRLMARRSDPKVASIDDCRAEGRVVGTLRESYAQRWLEAEGIDFRTYDDQVTPYLDLESGRLDGVLMEESIAIYYGAPRPALRSAGEPFGELRYGIGVRKGEARLRAELDAALEAAARNGSLRAIYERWGLWNPLAARCLGDERKDAREPAAATAYEDFLAMTGGGGGGEAGGGASIFAYLRVLLAGTLVTIALTACGMALAMALGLALALARLEGGPIARGAAVAYIEAVRGTPLLIQLLLLYYGLAQLGVLLPAFVAGFVGLGLNYAASEAENYRSGLQSVPKGQVEAALSLGLTRGQALRHVVVPQAVRVVIPSLTNDLIAMFKDSSIVSVIAIVELTKAYQMLAPISGNYFGVGLLAAGIYLGIGALVAFLSRRLERRLAPASPARRAPEPSRAKEAVAA